MEKNIEESATPADLLLYWIRERYKIFLRKENGFPKPWSEDPVFQKTYFCNVRREDDKITKWIRNYYSPYVGHGLFEYNILLARFLNWPDTLELLGYQEIYQPNLIQAFLEMKTDAKFQVWGNAYVITTHGIKMPKAQYLCENVLPAAYAALERHRAVVRGPRCGAAAQALQEIEGVGSFLAGQIVADLKNTVGHPLKDSYDFMSFVVPGPGSIRGLSWVAFGREAGVTPATFHKYFDAMRHYVDPRWPEEVPRIHNQDLQNCLCEFDKYMRVRNGTGRSKRNYNGT